MEAAPLRGCWLNGPNAKLLLHLPLDAKPVVHANRSFLSQFDIPADASLIELQMAAYRASPAEFSWRMSRRSLRRLEGLLLYKRLACASFAQEVKYLETDELQGRLLVLNGGVEFTWVLKSEEAMGTIFLFSDAIDFPMVQKIVGSVRCTGGVYSEELTLAEMEGLLKIE